MVVVVAGRVDEAVVSDFLVVCVVDFCVVGVVVVVVFSFDAEAEASPPFSAEGGVWFTDVPVSCVPVPIESLIEVSPEVCAGSASVSLEAVPPLEGETGVSDADPPHAVTSRTASAVIIKSAKLRKIVLCI